MGKYLLATMAVTVCTSGVAGAAHSATYFNDLEGYAVGEHLVLFQDPALEAVGVEAAGTIVELDGNKVLLLDEVGPQLRSNITWFGSGLGGVPFTKPSGEIALAYSLIVNPSFDLILPDGGQFWVQGSPSLLPPGVYHKVFSGDYVEGDTVHTRGPQMTYIDNISFSQRYYLVPEPETWALMIAGFGIAGAGLRRYRVFA